MRRLFRHYGGSILTVVILVLVLETVLRVFDVPTWMVPRPSLVWASFLDNAGPVGRNLRQTGIGAVAGLMIGTVLAIALAMLMVQSPVLERILMPLLLIEQSIPKVALAPVFVIWFGTGMTSRVVISVVISFFPVIINTLRGLTTVDLRLGWLMRSLSAGDTRTFIKIRLPNAVPYMFSGVKVAVPLAVIGAVVAEFVQADAGLGFLILMAQGHLDMPLIFVCVVVLALMSLGLYAAVSALEYLVMRRRFGYLQSGEGVRTAPG
jgi:NitT/TauT family transport system permease protein